MKRTERASRRGCGDMVVRRWLTLLLSLALLFMPFAGRGTEQQKIEYWLKQLVTPTPGPTGVALTYEEGIGRLRALSDRASIEEAKLAFESKHMEFSAEYAEYAKARLDLFDGDLETAILRLSGLCDLADFVQDARANDLPAPASLLNYAQARKLEEEGDLAGAMALYGSDYVLDVGDRLLEIRKALNEGEYARAEGLAAEGRYGEAAATFEALDSYRDSAKRAKDALALVPTPTPAPVQFAVYGDHVVITGFIEPVDALIIPERIGKLPVTGIGDRAFYNCTMLTTITIPESVTSIGDWAFRACGNLTDLTIPENVTSIGDHAFAECPNLVVRCRKGSATARYCKKAGSKRSIYSALCERGPGVGRGDKTIADIPGRLVTCAKNSWND